MARLPRIIVPNVPHHITQRGNRRQQTFFDDSDYKVYVKHLFGLANDYRVRIISYCLMPNHVHLLLVPPSKEALTAMITTLHQTYTRYINLKNSWSGHLWQGRFYSVPLSPEHFEICKTYIMENPMRANISKKGQRYQWSFCGEQAEHNLSGADVESIRKISKTGRPVGSEAFLNLVFAKTCIDPRPKRRKNGSSSSPSRVSPM